MSSQSLQILQEVAEAIAAQYLEGYTAELKAGAATRLGRKEINDALWGTVSLSPIEVAVLDSPLLQRLRFVRQMGAAHWVYPGAVHTRFEHAIGTLYQTQQLIDSLNARARANVQTLDRASAELINEEDAQLLRLSSLFSHVGHLAFSDSAVAELESQSDFETVTRDFAADTTRMDLGADPSFSQLLAHYIVKSPAVRELLLTLIRESVLQIKDKSDEPAVDYAIEKISLTVIGRMIDEKRPQLQELVTGPFDAATLDELVRDAKFSGIPSVLDIRRLIQKLAVQPFYAEDLPPWIGGSLVGIEQRQIVQIFGVPANATSVLNELQLAQVLVTTKIRRHPKVLATEQMLRSVIRTLGNLTSSKILLTFLYMSAEDVFIALTKESLAVALRRSPETSFTDEETEKLELAANTLSAIRERRVWVRALQLSELSIESDLAESIGMNLLQAELGHVQRGAELVTRLCTEVAWVRRATNQPNMSEVKLAAQINLRSLRSISAEPRIGRAIVLPPAKAPYMLSHVWGGEDNWVSQYLRGQPTTYLFSAPGLADSVYLAFERLADRLFKAALPSGTIEASKRTKADIQRLKHQATESGFWHGHSWPVRPRATIWDSLSIANRIGEVAFKLNKVDTISGKGDAQDRRDAAYRWLQQFETNRDIECALTMLERFQVVDRDKTTAAFAALFARHPEFRNAYAVSFGDPKDGGVIQGYFAADHPEVVKVLTLDQWLREEEDRPLIFVDDCCGSGSQVCDVLAAWLEREDLREPLEEKRDPLPGATQEKLRKTKIAFLFIAAWDAGVTKIREGCAKLGLDAIVFPYLPEADIPFAEKALIDANQKATDVEAFIDRCKLIGAQILQSNAVDADKIEQRRLGYGNKGMLLATLVNVPTQTTTLIWKSGTVDGTRWEALLPRRSKS